MALSVGGFVDGVWKESWPEVYGEEHSPVDKSLLTKKYEEEHSSLNR